MRVRGSLVLGGLVAIAAIAAVVACVRNCDRDDVSKQDATMSSRRLDVPAFRVDLAARLKRAAEIRARPNAAARSLPRDKWAGFGSGAIPSMGNMLIDPQCSLGPRELCTSLASSIHACDGGDARMCLAVGQYLTDNPPRPWIATTFFVQACRIGDPDGCERNDELMHSPDASKLDCARDPFACSVIAYRTQDFALHERACALGAAESCTYMSWHVKDDLERSRAYLERSCQLGLSLGCASLGHALSPGCASTEWVACYPPDPDEARDALLIGCLAGWDFGKNCDQVR